MSNVSVTFGAVATCVGFFFIASLAEKVETLQETNQKNCERTATAFSQSGVVANCIETDKGVFELKFD